MLVGLVWARPCWGEFWAQSTTEGYIRASMFGWVSLSFEPSQPQRVISELVCLGELVWALNLVSHTGLYQG